MKKIKTIALAMVLVMCTVLFASCKKEATPETVLVNPLETLQRIFTLAKEKNYSDLADYCRSFSPYSVELYFSDTGSSITKEQTEKYSEILYKLFTEYVSWTNLTESVDYDKREAIVTGTFTSLDLEKFGEMTDPEINKGLKTDFDAQMKYLQSVIGDNSLKSKPFKLQIEFRYTNKEWVLCDKNFLLLLTLGYYKG